MLSQRGFTLNEESWHPFCYCDGKGKLNKNKHFRIYLKEMITMQKRNIQLIAELGTVLIVLMSFGGCEISLHYDDTYVEQLDWELNGHGISLIDAQAENAAITIVGSNRNKVIVNAFLEIRADSHFEDAEEFARKVHVFVERQGDEIRIYKEYPRIRRGINVSVGYDIQVPFDVDVYLRTSNGKIQVSDVDGSISAFTSNGKIELQDVTGSIDTHTSNGKIEAFVERLEGEGVFSTSNGSINVEIHRGVAPVMATTSNSSIDITLPEDFSGQLDASTSNGSVSCSIPVLVHGKLKKNQLVGEIGEGGETAVTLRTSNGSIHLGSF